METDGGIFYSCNKNDSYISRYFEKIFVSEINMFLFIEYVTCRKEYPFTQIDSVLIGRSKPGGKRLLSGGVSSELRVERVVPLTPIFLSYRMYKCSWIFSSK